MIAVTNLSKTFGQSTLFEGVSLIVSKGERIGLVGRNGHGKSTLLKIIAGTIEPDSGVVDIPADYRIGHLSQHLRFTRTTAVEEVSLALSNDEGWQKTYLVEQALQGLGFTAEQMSESPQKLSGGYQIRLNLAKLLVSEPDLLLLDEPTNYLDIVSVRWLVRFLNDWKGELLLVTHDRNFMDSVVTHTAGIHRQKIRKIKGVTENYYEKIAQDEIIYEKTRINQDKKREKTEEFITRFRAKATKAKAVQSRVKALDRQERLEKLSDVESLEFRFRAEPFKGKFLMQVEGVEFGYNESLIKDLNISVKSHDRLAVIGKNGKGKSTLLQLLAKELTPRAGSIAHSTNLKLGYFGQTNIDRLDLENTVEDEIWTADPLLSRTAIRSICGLMLFSGDDALKKVQVLSGGERSRVMLGKLLVSGVNLLLLDEPTNHLDIESSEMLLAAVEEFPGAVIMVTHNEGTIREMADRLIVFDRDEVSLFEGTYDDFLSRVGWNDEDDLRPKSRAVQSGGQKLDKKELRRQRAAIISERSQTLGPLTRSSDSFEQELEALAVQINEANEALIEASKDGFGDDAARIARELSAWKEREDEVLEELENLSQEIDLCASRFQKKLDALN